MLNLLGALLNVLYDSTSGRFGVVRIFAVLDFSVLQIQGSNEYRNLQTYHILGALGRAVRSKLTNMN